MDGVKVDEDNELDVMQLIAKVLSPLEPQVRRRILIWASDKYEVGRLPVLKQHVAGADVTVPDVTLEQEADSQDIAELFENASHATDDEKVLTVAYWMQEICKKSVTATPLNKELKELGHRVSNVNRAFARLMEQKPALIIQTHKSGKAKQGRKTYRVTSEGIKAVKASLIRQSSQGE